MKTTVLFFFFVIIAFCSINAQNTLESHDMETGRYYYENQDFYEALPYLQCAAKEGYAEAQFYLGNMYFEGFETVKDRTIAIRMFDLAIAQDYVPAQAVWGAMLIFGVQIKKDVPKGVALLGKAAKVNEGAFGMLQKIAETERLAQEELENVRKFREDLQVSIQLDTDQFSKTHQAANDVSDLQDNSNKKEIAVSASQVENTIYESDRVEQMPEFSGGQAELMHYLSGKIKYPEIAQEQGIQGTVVLRFVVGKDGSVSDIQVLRSLDPSCDKEAMRVVKGMPKWVPGKQNGKPVAVYYTFPVRFKLN